MAENEHALRPLDGKIALVAGATRGAGRGIAVSLGELGATVYCTGRSTRDQRSDYDRPETIEETAELVTEAGGTGVWARVDHLERDQVAALVQRIDDEAGALDIFVNDLGGEHLHHDHWGKKLWEHDLDAGFSMLRTMIGAHLITAHYALGLLARRPGGLAVEVTDGNNAFNRDQFRVNVFFDLAKTGLNRLAFGEGADLAEAGGTAFAVTPGWLRSEMMLDAFGVTEDDWFEKSRASTGAEGEPPPDFAVAESPRFVGRGIAAAAADPDRHRWNQQSVTSFDLATRYGLYDTDGSRPDAWRFIIDKERGGNPDVADYR